MKHTIPMSNNSFSGVRSNTQKLIREIVRGEAIHSVRRMSLDA